MWGLDLSLTWRTAKRTVGGGCRIPFLGVPKRACGECWEQRVSVGVVVVIVGGVKIKGNPDYQHNSIVQEHLITH